MVQITVTDELAQAIENAGPLAMLVDSRGRAVGQILRTAKELNADVAQALERMEEAKCGGKFFATKEVLQHLHLPE